MYTFFLQFFLSLLEKELPLFWNAFKFSCQRTFTEAKHGPRLIPVDSAELRLCLDGTAGEVSYVPPTSVDVENHDKSQAGRS